MDRKERRPSLEMLRGEKPDTAAAILKKVDRYITKAGNTNDVEWLKNVFQACNRLSKEEDLSPENEEKIKELFEIVVVRLQELEIPIEEVGRSPDEDLDRKKENYNV